MRFLKFIPFVCFCLSLFAFSSGFCDENSQKILLDVLATKYMQSRIANISPGEVVHAHTIKPDDRERGYDVRDCKPHIACYLDAEVCTKIRGFNPLENTNCRFADQQTSYSGGARRQQPERKDGFQIVWLFNVDEMGAFKVNEAGEIITPADEFIESSNWTVTEVDGAKYIVHDHENFLVYTNETDQFVVGK